MHSFAGQDTEEREAGRRWMAKEKERKEGEVKEKKEEGRLRKKREGDIRQKKDEEWVRKKNRRRNRVIGRIGETKEE
jgi:hypothetical protein